MQLMANSSKMVLLKKVPMEYKSLILPLFIGMLICPVQVYICSVEKDFWILWLGFSPALNSVGKSLSDLDLFKYFNTYLHFQE